MTSALVGDTSADHEDRASGYRRARRDLLPAREDDLSIKYPGGGLSASAVDLAHFVQALFQGQLLNPESLEFMWKQKQLQDGSVTNKGYGCNIGREKDR